MALSALDRGLDVVLGEVVIMSSLFEHSVGALRAIFEREWPVLLVMHDGEMCGLVLKGVGEKKYERMGVLEKSEFVEGTWRVEGGRAWFAARRSARRRGRKSAGFKTVEIECWRDSIELV